MDIIIIVLGVLAVAFSVYSVIKRKKKGCCQHCNSCGYKKFCGKQD